MPVRFQADADFNQIVVSAVVRRFPEIDLRTATAAGLAGLKDAEVLALAAHDGRILVTHDHTTMPTHFGVFIRSTPSPGLIIVPQNLALREAVDALILIWAAIQRISNVWRPPSRSRGSRTRPAGVGSSRMSHHVRLIEGFLMSRYRELTRTNVVVAWLG